MSPSNQGDILLKILENKDDLAFDVYFDDWKKDKTHNVCYWEGIICDSKTESIVERIFIPTKNMTGTLPSDLGLLRSLREISMPGNLLEGTIPSEITALPNLEKLNLSTNRFVGTLPAFKSTILTSLELQKNRLTGSIDPDIGNRHVAIEELDFSSNELTGTIPVSLEKMKNLDSLALGENRLSGTIPPEIGTLKSLRFAYFNKNHLVGTIPPCLSDLPNLEYLWLQDNMLSGTVPAAFADVSKLTDFYIDGNKLTGTIPEGICQKGLNQEFFDDDEVTNVKNNGCDDIACPPGTTSKDGIGPCYSCEGDSYNPYIGWDRDCREVNNVVMMDRIYEKTSADGWKKPWDVNEIHCDLPGVQCDDMGHIIGLNLKGMGLSGTIPEEFGYFKYLRTLDLSDNDLTGYLPSELRFAPLEKLDVSGNKLKGVVPLMLCIKPGINGNGYSNDLGCDHIACPVGSYSSSGVGSSEKSCTACMGGGGQYLASTSCGTFAHSGFTAAKGFGIFVLVALSAMSFFFIVQKLREKYIERQKPDRSEFKEVSDGGELS